MVVVIFGESLIAILKLALTSLGYSLLKTEHSLYNSMRVCVLIIVSVPESIVKVKYLCLYLWRKFRASWRKNFISRRCQCLKDYPTGFRPHP